MNNFAKWIIDNHSKLQKSAIVDPGGFITYSELSQLIFQFASVFLKKGIVAHQHVVIVMDDCKEWPAVALGLLAIGANIVLLSPNICKTDIDFYCKESDSDAVITDQDYHFSNITNITLAELMLARDHTDIEFYDWHDDEACLWLLTSGTGGKSKCIIHRHAMFMHNLHIVGQSSIMNISKDSIIYSTGKLYWAWGFCANMIFGLAQGATVCVLPGLVSPRRICNWAKQCKITHLYTVPTMINSLIKHQSQAQLPTSIKHIFSGGEPLTRTMVTRFEKVCQVPLCDVLGTCESMQVAYRLPNDRGLIPFDGVELQLRDSTREATHLLGELYVKTPVTALGYYKNYASTKHTFVGEWARTGDLMEQYPDGSYNYVSRVTDLVKINAKWVDIHEIETQLLSFDNVDDCCVVSCTNQHGLLELHAFLVSADGVNTESIKHQLQSLVSHVPKVFRLIPELPRTINSKKMRNTLATMCG